MTRTNTEGASRDLFEFAGIAAAEDLSALLSKDDFEPTVEVDTAALDATLDALIGARALAARLEALRAHLAAGNTDAATRIGLAVDVRLTIERLDAVTLAVFA